MAEITDGEVVVDRDPLVRSRLRSAHPVGNAIALIVLVAFALTCVVVFAGGQLGLRAPYPIEQVAQNMKPQPTPPAP